MNGREIEKKYVMEGVADIRAASLNVFKALHNFMGGESMEEGSDYDTYYSSPEHCPASFIRVRESSTLQINSSPFNEPARRQLPNLLGEMTVKTCDKGSNTDRKEINIQLGTERAHAFCAEVFGGPLATVTKRFSKFPLTFAEVAIYQVDDDSRIFLEIEANNLALVNATEIILREGGIQLSEEPRSIYEIFVKGNK